MKRRTILSVLLIIIIIACYGCGNANADNNAEAQSTNETTYLSIGTGSVTGVYYPLGGALSSIISNNIEGYNCAAESTGGAVENAALLIDGKLDLVIEQLVNEDQKRKLSSGEQIKL